MRKAPNARNATVEPGFDPFCRVNAGYSITQDPERPDVDHKHVGHRFFPTELAEIHDLLVGGDLDTCV